MGSRLSIYGLDYLIINVYGFYTSILVVLEAVGHRTIKAPITFH